MSSSTIPDQQQQQQQRLPSSGTDADQEDVGAVVAKAKKAAASLWMIIHAQGCRLGPDRCPHRGCADTKRLLLHIKTCPAGPGFSCPVRGCDSARKLLAHYRRCRDIRARQAAGRCLKPPGQHQQHVCLVCSLMARHAKTLLDGSNKKVAVADVTKSERWRARRDAAIVRQQQMQQQQIQQHHLTRQPQPEQRDVGRSKSFEEIRAVEHVISKDQAMSEPVPGSIRRTTSTLMMPPPPPRPPRGNMGIAAQLSTSAPNSPAPLSSMHGSAAATTPYETPPSNNVLMQYKIEAVAASVAPPPIFANENTNASALGKSYDSSRSYFPASLVAKYAATEPQYTTDTRPRSESFQTASSFRGLSLGESNPSREQGSSSTIVSPNDASLNQAHDEQVQGGKGTSDLFMRKSASCGTLMSFVDSGGCTTIKEEEADEPSQSQESHDNDGGVFEMTDDNYAV